MKKTILQAAKSLVIAIAFIIAANYSVAFASIWVGPTAAPPGNNAEAPINVSGVAQSKDGSIWIDGVNSLGDKLYTSLIVNNGRVAIGTTTVPASSKLGINGNIAAGQYCDLNGVNCFNSSYVYNLSTTTGGGGVVTKITAGTSTLITPSTGVGNVTISVPDPLALYKATKSRTAWPSYVYCQNGNNSQLFMLVGMYTPPAVISSTGALVSVMYVLADQGRIGFNSTGALVYTYDGNNGGTYTGTCPTQLNLNGSANIVQGV